MLTDQQLPGFLRAVIDEQLAVFSRARTVQVRNEVPDTTLIPIENPNHWLRIPDVVCVFVDMKGSTQLSAATEDKSTAGAYQLFTGTAVRLFDELDAPYIDIRGDGVFALFNSNQPHRALAAAVSFQTFATLEFVPKIEALTGLRLGAHIGIDQKTVLVRKLGLKRHQGRTDRQNEVWAGKPVNMASKLASIADSGETYVSDRFFARLEHDRTKFSCGCVGGVPSANRTFLWKAVSVRDDPKFDFDTAYALGSYWCEHHGKEYCSSILDAD